MGISAQDLTRLFQPFTQVDSSSSRRFGGTGLGLSICQQLATLMNGEIQVESQPGQGSCFWLNLPVLPATAASNESPRATSNNHTQPNSARILLVEDNNINQLIAHAQLGKLGYDRVFTANDGLQAIAITEHEKIDLILMDCQMPVLDGFEATRRLRAMGYQNPIIAMTANNLPGDRAACLDAGMNDFLSKPVTQTELKTAMRLWLRHIRA